MLDTVGDMVVVSAYTRRMAIDDGVLMDVSDTAREAGIIYPVALTERVVNEVVVPDDESAAQGQDADGRLWDVLWMFRSVVPASRASQFEYDLLVVRQGRTQTVRLKAVCGPGDEGEPVITIMFPEED